MEVDYFTTALPQEHVFLAYLSFRGDMNDRDIIVCLLTFQPTGRFCCCSGMWCYTVNVIYVKVSG